MPPHQVKAPSLTFVQTADKKLLGQTSALIVGKN
jgi:hypothetical protein